MSLSDDICDFLSGGVSIIVAARNALLRPSISRARGCRVVRDGDRRLRILVSIAQAGDLLDDVRSTGLVAVTFSVPSTHRTLQFKGVDAHIAPVDDDDRAVMRAYAKAFAMEIRPLGFSGEFAQTFLTAPDDEVAIEFTPNDVFQQTPGPQAGARLT